MQAVVGGLLVMSAGNTLKVTGKDTAAGWSITTTGTAIETGIIVRKSGIRTMIASSRGMIASSRGMNTDSTNTSRLSLYGSGPRYEENSLCTSFEPNLSYVPLCYELDSFQKRCVKRNRLFFSGKVVAGRLPRKDREEYRQAASTNTGFTEFKDRDSAVRTL